MRRAARSGPLDPESAAAVERTFLVVRIVRGSLLAAFLALAIVGVAARGWPRGIAVGIGIVLVLQVMRVGASVRRYATGRSAR